MKSIKGNHLPATLLVEIIGNYPISWSPSPWTPSCNFRVSMIKFKGVGVDISVNFL